VIIQAIVNALASAFDMLWEVLWPLALGFILSAIVQTLVSRSAVARTLGSDSPRSLGIATLLGAASSSTVIREIDWKNGFGTTGTLIGDRKMWGKGIGREVMQLRTRYAFTQLPLRKLKSSYFGGNVASGRAQAAAGYREIGRYRADRYVDGQWVDEVVTEVLREDWLKENSV